MIFLKIVDWNWWPLYQPNFSMTDLMVGFVLLVSLLCINKLFFSVIWTKDATTLRSEKVYDGPLDVNPIPLTGYGKKAFSKRFKVIAFLLAVLIAFQTFASLLSPLYFPV